MDNFQNIEDTKEYALAKEVEAAVNNYGFKPKVFAAAITMMHPTNQQSLYRLIRECLRVMADESRRYDERNIASHKEARRIMDFLDGNEAHIPMR